MLILIFYYNVSADTVLIEIFFFVHRRTRQLEGKEGFLAILFTKLVRDPDVATSTPPLKTTQPVLQTSSKIARGFPAVVVLR